MRTAPRVITSYSIHYTKLYDAERRRREDAIADTMVRYARTHRFDRTSEFLTKNSHATRLADAAHDPERQPEERMDVEAAQFASYNFV